MLLYHSEIESRESGVGSRKGKLQSLKQKRLVQDEDEGVCFAVPPQFAIFSALGCRQSSTYAVTGMPVTFYSSSEMRGAVISSSNDPGDFSGDFLRRLPPYISFSISLRTAYYSRRNNFTDYTEGWSDSQEETNDPTAKPFNYASASLIPKNCHRIFRIKLRYSHEGPGN